MSRPALLLHRLCKSSAWLLTSTLTYLTFLYLSHLFSAFLACPTPWRSPRSKSLTHPVTPSQPHPLTLPPAPSCCTSSGLWSCPQHQPRPHPPGRTAEQRSGARRRGGSAMTGPAIGTCTRSKPPRGKQCFECDIKGVLAVDCTPCMDACVAGFRRTSSLSGHSPISPRAVSALAGVS